MRALKLATPDDVLNAFNTDGTPVRPLVVQAARLMRKRYEDVTVQDMQRAQWHGYPHFNCRASPP